MGSFNSKANSVDELKSQLNIVDVVGRVIPLKRAGANYKGVCPFHNEKTPSFVVSDQKQIFTCFGCGATGDMIEFTKRYYNLDFIEACEKLAKENGLNIDFDFGAPDKGERERAFEMNREAARFFFNSLSKEKNPGYTYMHGRGITDQTLKKFGIGYAPEGWDNLLNYMKAKGYKEDELVNYSLLRPGKEKGKPYDYFRNRVIFPIISPSGKVVGFQSRKIDKDDPSAKYINTVDNLVFHKKDTIFGINITKQEIAKEGYVILVEGNMDVISLYQSGIHNVGASCGTALNENQAKLLKRYADSVVLCYDSDNAGQEADLKGIEVLSKVGLKVKVMSVTSGKDPDEFVKEYGKEAFLELAEKAIPGTEFKLNYQKKGLNLKKEEDKLTYMKKAATILKELSPVEQDIYVKKLAEELRISESAIKREIDGTKIENRPELKREKEEDSLTNLTKLELTLLKTVLTNPSLTDNLFENQDVITTSQGKKIFNIVFDVYAYQGTFELENITDRLDVDESKMLDNELEKIIVHGNEEKIFDDCIKSFKLDKLENERKMIIDVIDLADEENNEEKVVELTKKLIELQEEINSLKR